MLVRHSTVIGPVEKFFAVRIAKRLLTLSIANILVSLVCSTSFGALAFFCLRYNFDIRASHIPGLSNIHADLLSRLDVDKWLCDQAPPGISPSATPLSALPSLTSKATYGSF